MEKTLLSIRLSECKMRGMETLGQRVKRTMGERRPALPGYRLAALLDRQASYVSKLVNDRLMETPPPDVLQGLERVLGIPVAWSLRAWGYALDDTPGRSVAPVTFPETSPAAKVVEILRHLPDEHADWVLATARFAERKARGERDEDDEVAIRVGGTRRMS